MSQENINEDNKDLGVHDLNQGEPTKEEEKMVQLPQSKFDKLLARLDRLEQAADKKQLSRIDGLNPGEKEKLVNLRTFEGKVVLGWGDMNKNVVEKHPLTGVWKEDQEVELKLEGVKELKKVPFVIFSRNYRLLPALVESETKTSSGDVILKVKTVGEEEEYDINIKFVN